MRLSKEEQAMLAGEAGPAVRKAMEILAALGEIYGAQEMVLVSSVQIAGVSYDNLGEAGLEFLAQMADGGGRARVLATLNPAGMDVENWQALGISPEFAEKQARVIEAFARMGVVTTCTCTPYLSGNLPHFGEHIAWAESSAVCYANSVIGARTNREGGPSALAAALTGRTPAYGYHLDAQRQPGLLVEVQAQLSGSHEFGALGKAIGEVLEGMGKRAAPYIRGIDRASLEELKSFCASLATYGGAALFHMEGITPEAGLVRAPEEVVVIGEQEIQEAVGSLSGAESSSAVYSAPLAGSAAHGAPDAVSPGGAEPSSAVYSAPLAGNVAPGAPNGVSPGGAEPEIDFVSLGCPHLSLAEIQRLAQALQGKEVRREFWITTSRPVKQIADRMGYSQVIEASGARFAVDTCCVVAPIRGRFHTLATDSAKACYYAASKHQFGTVFKSFDEVIQEALR